MTPQQRIRLARRHAGLSQAALGTAVGVQRSAVSHWEATQGKHPSMAHLRELALVTGVQFEWLATGRGGMGLSADTALDSVAAADALLVDDPLELRLIAAFREPRCARGRHWSRWPSNWPRSAPAGPRAASGKRARNGRTRRDPALPQCLAALRQGPVTKAGLGLPPSRPPAAHSGECSMRHLQACRCWPPPCCRSRRRPRSSSTRSTTTTPPPAATSASAWRSSPPPARASAATASTCTTAARRRPRPTTTTTWCPPAAWSPAAAASASPR